MAHLQYLLTDQQRAAVHTQPLLPPSRPFLFLSAVLSGKNDADWCHRIAVRCHRVIRPEHPLLRLLALRRPPRRGKQVVQQQRHGLRSQERGGREPPPQRGVPGTAGKQRGLRHNGLQEDRLVSGPAAASRLLHLSAGFGRVTSDSGLVMSPFQTF